MTHKKETLNLGASRERDAWLAKLRRDLRLRKGAREAAPTCSEVVTSYIQALLEWGLARHKRYGKRKGGLGRK